MVRRGPPPSGSAEKSFPLIVLLNNTQKMIRKIEKMISLLLLGLSLFITLDVGAPTSSFAAQGSKNGMDLSRFDAMAQLFDGYIQNGDYAGIISLVQRNGKIVDFRAHGYRDLERKLPMEKDTIVRVYSMTKLVTSVAVLQLMEDGKIILDAPLGNYLLEFKEPRQILMPQSGKSKKPIFRKSKTPLTIRHLLTHTAGYPYSSGTETSFDRIYSKADLWHSPTLKEFSLRVSRLPLKHEPGNEFTYGISADILGYLVEKVSGLEFEEYLRQRIFEPLKMRDTFFKVPPEKLHRVAKVYGNENGPALSEHRWLTDLIPLGKTPWGGAGLFSTAEDFARFAQMLLNEGSDEGNRILSRKTVELMTANHLEALTGERFHDGTSREPFVKGKGFGLGVEIHVDQAQSGLPVSRGQFGWYGAATTYCQIDPKEGLVAILLAPYWPQNRNSIFERFATMTNSAFLNLSIQKP